MALITLRNAISLLENSFQSLTISHVQIRQKFKRSIPQPRLRNPTWFTKKHRTTTDTLTAENQSFLKEVTEDRFLSKPPEVPKELVSNIELTLKMQRTGLIARKLGNYPMWFKNGKKISTTLLQVLDNHVIKYVPPELYNPPRGRVGRVYNRKGCLLLGAEPADPSNFTREYCGLFSNAGVIPKKTLARFFVSSDAALPPGTLLSAQHFQVGHYVDVRGLTIDRGFQGVMKRHGFHGMPASHGVTKTHRRGGNIGGGGEKGRVWPGTKMPGHMGNRWRILRALRILRINTKHNVLFVTGQNIAGATNSIVYIYDSKVITRRPNGPIPYPTHFGDENAPENIYADDVYEFGAPSITYEEAK